MPSTTQSELDGRSVPTAEGDGDNLSPTISDRDPASTWVFGYGSLMCNGWETNLGCLRRLLAELSGYRRTFSKLSVRNWGTREAPCPTLNLEKADFESCWGIAFEFPDRSWNEVLNYLSDREGRDFALRELPIRVEGEGEVMAFAPVYDGRNVLQSSTLQATASMVVTASGTKGACSVYVRGIAEELVKLGIDDPVVAELWKAVKGLA